MLSFLKLIRYQNLIMILIIMVLTKYTLIHAFKTTPTLTTIQFSILTLSILFITIGGYIVNDIYDLEIDLINKPSKVYVNQSISVRKAWNAYFTFSIIGILLGIYLSFEVKATLYSLIFIITTFILFIYTRYLKKWPLLGNIIIAFLGSLVIYLVYLFETVELQKGHGFWEALSNFLTHIGAFVFIIYYCTFSFLTTLIREIIKDIIDINGDYHAKMKTLPIVLGVRRSKIVAIAIALLLLFLLCLSTNDFFHSELYILGGYFIVCILFPLAYFIYILWNAEKKKEFIFLSHFMKVIMLLGIFSMLLIKF